MSKSATEKEQEIQTTVTEVTNSKQKADRIALESSQYVQKALNIKSDTSSLVEEITRLYNAAKKRSEDAINAEVAARSAADVTSAMARKASEKAAEAESARNLVIQALDLVTQMSS